MSDVSHPPLKFEDGPYAHAGKVVALPTAATSYNPDPAMTGRVPKARKTRRNTHACDACSRRSVKCKSSTEDVTRCQNCVDFNESCTLDRPMRKRGKPVQSQLPPVSEPSLAIDTGTHVSPLCATRTLLCNTSATAQQQWMSPLLRDSEPLTLRLVDIFFEVVFPVFPLFSRPIFLQKVTSKEHLKNRAFYAALSALCALVIARARDGAIDDSKQYTLQSNGLSSENFFAAAEKALPTTASLTGELEYMQAYILLSITSIQYGDSKQARFYLNLYHNCVAVNLLHNEEEWPHNLSISETEERRRLFWSAYTLDVFTSLIWKGVVRSSELAFNVRYPAGDDLLHHTLSNDPLGVVEAEPSWLCGWNFVTDLYRLLEHVLHHLRPRSQRTPAIKFDVNEDWQAMTTNLLQRVTEMYNELPAIFKSTRPPTNDVSKDLYSFQAANIVATVQLVRMVLFTIKRSSVEEKCKIASEVIMVFANIPKAYLRAISSPLLLHLAGIGILLGSTIYERLSESAYSLLRTVLLEFATLISDLEHGLQYEVGDSPSDKLRAQLTTLDRYWADQTQQAYLDFAKLSNGPAPPCDLPVPETEYAFGSSLEAGSDSISFPPELLEDWSSIFDFL